MAEVHYGDEVSHTGVEAEDGERFLHRCCSLTESLHAASRWALLR